MGVMAMLNQAKRNSKLYDELRSLGYGDDEFPDWWYSPARSPEIKQEPPTIEQEPPMIEQEQPGSDGLTGTELTPPGPKTPVPTSPIEEVPGRPQLREPIPSDPDPSGESLSDPETSHESFTGAELNLLGSNKIVRGQDGIWVHIEKEPSGRTIIARER